MKKNKKYYVFVYGTLKKGFGNHHLLENSKFIGNAITKEKDYLMINLGVPFVKINDDILLRNYEKGIYGEVYEVDLNTLKRLDILEGHPNWYKRKIQKFLLYNVKTKKFDKLVKAYIYLCNKEDYNIYNLEKNTILIENEFYYNYQ